MYMFICLQNMYVAMIIKKIRGHEFGKGAAEGTEGIKIMGMVQIQNSP